MFCPKDQVSFTDVSQTLSGRELRHITLAQIIGCVLVIFGHSFPFVTEIPMVMTQLRVWLYCFHMPLFVWCSGFLFAYTHQTEKNGLGGFAGKRAMKILVPYVALSLVGIVPKALSSSVLNDALSLDAYSVMRAFLVPRENIWGHFWFLPMIYLLGVGCFVLDILFRWLRFRKELWLAMTGVLLVISELKSDAGKWFGMNDVLHYGWIYALGIVAAQIDTSRINNLNRKQSLLCIVCGGGNVLISIVIYVWFNKLIGIDLTVRNAAIALLMTAGIVAVSLSLARICHIDRHSLLAQTYQIFILSWPCQLVVEIVTERLLHLPWWILMPSVFAVGICGPLLLIKLIDLWEGKHKSRVFSIILGR